VTKGGTKKGKMKSGKSKEGKEIKRNNGNKKNLKRKL
jgi:hypothetical protein